MYDDNASYVKVVPGDRGIPYPPSLLGVEHHGSSNSGPVNTAAASADAASTNATGGSDQLLFNFGLQVTSFPEHEDTFIFIRVVQGAYLSTRDIFTLPLLNHGKMS